MQFVIPPEWDGKTLKEYLTKSEELHISSRLLKRLKYQPMGMTVNQNHVTVRYILRTGEILNLQMEDNQANPSAPQPIPLNLPILYEDEDIILPSKPPHMPTHLSHGHTEDTLANALAYHFGGQNHSLVFRPINRLDKDTSGVLLVAKNQQMAQRLCASMKKGAFKKIYLAVLKGVLSSRDGVIQTGITRSEASIIVREICPIGYGDYAETSYHTVAVSLSEKFSLVAAWPKTGRTHQLRVHFAHMGCPIIGDFLYGEEHPDMPRQALHAYQLSFPHPRDGHKMTVSAPLPVDMLHFIRLYFSVDMGNKWLEELSALNFE